MSCGLVILYEYLKVFDLCTMLASKYCCNNTLK